MHFKFEPANFLKSEKILKLYLGKKGGEKLQEIKNGLFTSYQDKTKIKQEALKHAKEDFRDNLEKNFQYAAEGRKIEVTKLINFYIRKIKEARDEKNYDALLNLITNKDVFNKTIIDHLPGKKFADEICKMMGNDGNFLKKVRDITIEEIGISLDTIQQKACPQ